MRIGVPLGAAAMTLAEKEFNKAKIEYFNSLADGYAAVQYNKIDAFIFDRHSMLFIINNNPLLKLLPEDIGEEHIVIGFPKKHENLQKEINAFIKQYREDGTYQDMFKRWCESAVPPPMPEIPAPSKPTRKFIVGTEGLNEPMNYFVENGELTGFDIELIKRLALYLNAELEIVIMKYDALIPAATSGKIDMLIANLNSTPERGETILFSDDYVDSAIAIMVHKESELLQTGRNAKDSQLEEINSIADLAGKKAASLTGAGFQQLTDPIQSGISHVFFNDNSSSVQALRLGKVDAVLLDEPIAQLYAAAFPEDLRFVGIYAKDTYGIALSKGSTLAAKATEVIQKLKSSGEMQELIDKWTKGETASKKLTDWEHKKDWSGKNGTLRFASDPVLEPMCYIGSDGNAIGLDVELVRRIAYDLDMKFEFVPISFSALIESLKANKVDAVGGSMSITEERKLQVDFAESYYEGGLSIVARKTIKPLENTTSTIANISQLAGKRIGLLSGTTMDMFAKKTFTDSEIIYFNAFADLPIALDTGKIDAFLTEEPVARIITLSHPSLSILKDKLSFDDYAFIFTKDNEKLRDAFSKQIQAMKQDGTLKKLEEKWFTADFSSQPKPKQNPNPPKGFLTFATVPQIEPFSFLQNSEVAGFDIEVAMIAAERMGYGLKPVIVEWNAYLEMVMSGKVDLGVACTTITPERQEKVLFAEPNYNGGIVVVVKDFAKASAITEGEQASPSSPLSNIVE